MRKRILLAAAIAATFSSVANAQTNPYMGSIMIFGGNFCPIGWSTMNGQLLQINQNVALFSIVGTLYGGDGKKTFALPKATPLAAANGQAYTQCIALIGVYPQRS